jgi:hypothetical protein
VARWRSGSLAAIAAHVAADDEFRELHRVVSRGLSRVQFLTADGLRFLLGPYLEEESMERKILTATRHRRIQHRLPGEAAPASGRGLRADRDWLLEISAVSKPAHPATMALSWKSVDDHGNGNGVPSVDELRHREWELVLGMEAVRDQHYRVTLAALGEGPRAIAPDHGTEGSEGDRRTADPGRHGRHGA